MSELDDEVRSFWAAVNDGSKAECPVCYKMAAESGKSYNRFMAADLEILRKWESENPGKPIHGNTFFKDVGGNRGHDIATQRFFGVIESVDRPDDAPKSQKGSKGQSGFYKITQFGCDFVDGKTVIYRTVYRSAITSDPSYYPRLDGPTVTFKEARSTTLKVRNDIVVDGTSEDERARA